MLGPITSEFLSQQGHQPVLAASSEQALLILSTPNQIEVILLDLQLGNERGETVVQQLQSRGYVVPPIIILSALPMSQIMYAAQLVGAASVLEKPCAAQKMLRAIELAVV